MQKMLLPLFASAVLSVAVTPVLAQSAQTRCPDLNGDYDCPGNYGGCNALGIGHDEYIISHAGNPGGHTIMRPDASDVNLWLIVPAIGWEQGGYARTRANGGTCDDLYFGPVTWHNKNKKQ